MQGCGSTSRLRPSCRTRAAQHLARCCASNTASLASLNASFAASSAAIALRSISSAASAASTAACVGGIAQRVEDPDVVVRCDGGDDVSDGECCAVIFRHIRQLEPEEDCGASHASDAEREGIVNQAPLAIGEAFRKRRHCSADA